MYYNILRKLCQAFSWNFVKIYEIVLERNLTMKCFSCLHCEKYTTLEEPSKFAAKYFGSKGVLCDSHYCREKEFYVQPVGRFWIPNVEMENCPHFVKDHPIWAKIILRFCRWWILDRSWNDICALIIPILLIVGLIYSLK